MGGWGPTQLTGYSIFFFNCKMRRTRRISPVDHPINTKEIMGKQNNNKKKKNKLTAFSETASARHCGLVVRAPVYGAKGHGFESH